MSEQPEPPLIPRSDQVPPGTALMSNPDVVEWLATRIRKAEPTAAMRFGDSEARLLGAGTEGFPVDQTADMLEREAGIPFTSEDVLELQSRVALAFDQADILGIRYRAQFANEGKQARVALLASRHAKLARIQGPPVPLSRCLVSYAIADALPEMLAGRRASVISCRDLKPILEGDWGLDDVASYQVPSQAGFRDIDGEYEAAMHGERIWPDIHAQIRSSLHVRERGEVFLVGAGVFGKDLCIEVRRRGGIAVDLGSALDHIAGKLTRGPERRALELHNAGMSVPEIAAEMRRIYRTEVDEDAVGKRLGEILAEIGESPAASS